jgi:hypothetical protein
LLTRRAENAWGIDARSTRDRKKKSSQPQNMRVLVMEQNEI